jgi:hypothetical protein
MLACKASFLLPVPLVAAALGFITLFAMQAG